MQGPHELLHRSLIVECSIATMPAWIELVQAATHRPTAPVLPENDIHPRVAQTLDFQMLPPARGITFPRGNVKLPGLAAAKLARLRLKRGWPELLVLRDVAHGIELKRQDGTLSRTRKVRTRRGALRIVEGRDTFPRLEAAGMRIAVCRTVDEVLATLARWNVPLRVRV